MFYCKYSFINQVQRSSKVDYDAGFPGASSRSAGLAVIGEVVTFRMD